MQRRIGHGSWRDYRWSVLVEPDGDEQFLTADLTASDGRRHGSDMGGVHYLLHLIPASAPPSAVEVVGRTESGHVREAVRLR